MGAAYITFVLMHTIWRSAFSHVPKQFISGTYSTGPFPHMPLIPRERESPWLPTVVSTNERITVLAHTYALVERALGSPNPMRGERIM